MRLIKPERDLIREALRQYEAGQSAAWLENHQLLFNDIRTKLHQEDLVDLAHRKET